MFKLLKEDFRATTTDVWTGINMQRKSHQLGYYMELEIPEVTHLHQQTTLMSLEEGGGWGWVSTLKGVSNTMSRILLGCGVERVDTFKEGAGEKEDNADKENIFFARYHKGNITNKGMEKVIEVKSIYC